MNLCRGIRVCTLLSIMVGSACAGPVTIFSTGSFGLPESISAVPAAFGAFAGQLFVDDSAVGGAGPSTIWAVSAGGVATVFNSSALTTDLVRGGVFLPATFGALANQYLVAATSNLNFGGTPFTSLLSFNAAGAVTTAYSIPLASTFQQTFFSPIIAPGGFGPVAGDVLVILAGPSAPIVLALSPSGPASTFASLPNTSQYGNTIFAPAGFGGVGGDLLVDSIDGSGQIFAVDPSGNVRPWATVPLGPNQVGLRQMAFAPAGFGSYGGDLFVSVSGSNVGGGTFGSVDVLAPNGNIVAILSQGTVGAPFDPRGLYFLNNSTLLINDADPSILQSPPSAFTPIPEPGTAGIQVLGLLALALFSRTCLRSPARPTSL
jgi:hypothetical protein